jgi:hypothetical protein
MDRQPQSTVDHGKSNIFNLSLDQGDPIFEPVLEADSNEARRTQVIPSSVLTNSGSTIQGSPTEDATQFVIPGFLDTAVPQRSIGFTLLPLTPIEAKRFNFGVQLRQLLSSANPSAWAAGLGLGNPSVTGSFNQATSVLIVDIELPGFDESQVQQPQQDLWVWFGLSVQNLYGTAIGSMGQFAAVSQTNAVSALAPYTVSAPLSKITTANANISTTQNTYSASNGNPNTLISGNLHYNVGIKGNI